MTRAVQAARFDVALRTLDLITGHAGGWAPLTFARGDDRKLFWRRPLDDGLPWLVQRCDELWSDEITMGLPHRERFGWIHGATVLWARIEGKEQLRRARMFRPLPTCVLQEGSSSRRLLLWALDDEISYMDAEMFNRRIAYRVGAVQKWAAPEMLQIPCPGTCLRVGRARPIPIVVGRLTVASYKPAQVAGRLKDPPDIPFWELGRKANG